MAALSTYIANKFIDHVNGKTTATFPTVYVGLCTTASTAAAQGTEAAYTGYTRIAMGTAGASLMSAASAETTSNSSAITFPACTAGSSTVIGFFLADSATVSAGNLLLFGTCSLSVSAGITPSFAPTALTVSMS
jgi:hypothetical protein